jgi:hypothetical protein
MAPTLPCADFDVSFVAKTASLVSRSTLSELQLRNQWLNPSDILSLLLLLGPEVIQKSLAQLSGTHLVPVAFSFGWVAYAITALLSAFGGWRIPFWD